ncbi:MAG: hypothetical protein WEB00_06745 [Dehalococcoidia bacterium]
MDEEDTEDLATIIANTKGPRKKDLIKTAKAFERQKNKRNLTNAELGRQTQLSGEMVREFLTLLQFSEPIQGLFNSGKLKLEHGRRLAQLAKSERRQDVAEVATAIIGLPALEARQLVLYLIDHPELSVEQAKKDLLASRTVVIDEFHIVAVVTPEVFSTLQSEALSRGMSVSTLVTSVVEDWAASPTSNG